MCALSPASSSRISLPASAADQRASCRAAPDCETVMSNHGAKHHIGDPNATFGITEGNPIWEEMRDIALRAGPSFLLNVTLNEQRNRSPACSRATSSRRTRRAASLCGDRRCRRLTAPFDIVVTTNSGYPLDQNLYQGVKGMSAGARVLKPGGTLILACECREGVPANGSFDRILRSRRQPGGGACVASYPRFQPARTVAGATPGAHPEAGRRPALQLAVGRGRARRSFDALPRHRRGGQGVTPQAPKRHPHRSPSTGAAHYSVPGLRQRSNLRTSKRASPRG
jgi:hypothetical protein